MIKVLDHGFVRLVDHMGDDLSVVRAARNSHDAAWRAGADESKDEKLIEYLWSHQHGTPFEAVIFTFEVKAPIFVFRQWHRHRTQSYNEVSARYTELPEEFYIPLSHEIGAQDTKNKQARNVNLRQSLDEANERRREIATYIDTCSQSFAEYKYLLEQGWPRELARMVLPLSTYSKMFTTVDLRNLLGFLTLRCDEHAQPEIRVYGEAILELIRPLVPVCIHAWENNK